MQEKHALDAKQNAQVVKIILHDEKHVSFVTNMTRCLRNMSHFSKPSPLLPHLLFSGSHIFKFLSMDKIRINGFLLIGEPDPNYQLISMR